MRTAGQHHGRCGFAQLNNKRTGDIDSWFGANVNYSATPLPAQKIVTHAVGLGVDDIGNAMLQRRKLRAVNFALEHRVLHSDSHVGASTSNATQATAPCGGYGRNVVSDQHEQSTISLAPDK